MTSIFTTTHTFLLTVEYEPFVISSSTNLLFHSLVFLPSHDTISCNTALPWRTAHIHWLCSHHWIYIFTLITHSETNHFFHILNLDASNSTHLLYGCPSLFNHYSQYGTTSSLTIEPHPYLRSPAFNPPNGTQYSRIRFLTQQHRDSISISPHNTLDLRLFNNRNGSQSLDFGVTSKENKTKERKEKKKEKRQTRDRTKLAPGSTLS